MDDAQQLKLLSIFHYIVGALTALIACFPLLHMTLGLVMLFSPETFASRPGDQAPPQFVGWLFAGLGGLMFLSGQAMAICMILAGRFLARRKRYLFVFVVAAIECMAVPFGTVLGVFTILALSRESIKKLFDSYGATAPATMRPAQ